MQPVWERKFEPPAVTAGESQDVIETLFMLYDETGDERFLAAGRRAIAYLKTCLLPDGGLARFYELKTNRPLFFTKNYRLTDSRDDLPTHYAFLVPSRLDRLEAELNARATRGVVDVLGKRRPDIRRAKAIVEAQDGRGAWVDRDGAIRSQTFIDHMGALGQFVEASTSPRP
jgi:hypothetical protein